MKEHGIVEDYLNVLFTSSTATWQTYDRENCDKLLTNCLIVMIGSLYD